MWLETKFEQRTEPRCAGCGNTETIELVEHVVSCSTPEPLVFYVCEHDSIWRRPFADEEPRVKLSCLRKALVPASNCGKSGQQLNDIPHFRKCAGCGYSFQAPYDGGQPALAGLCEQCTREREEWRKSRTLDRSPKKIEVNVSIWQLVDRNEKHGFDVLWTAIKDLAAIVPQEEYGEHKPIEVEAYRAVALETMLAELERLFKKVHAHGVVVGTNVLLNLASGAVSMEEFNRLTAPNSNKHAGREEST